MKSQATIGLFCASVVTVLAALTAAPLAGQVPPLTDPRVDSASWVLIEIWPTVGNITFAAYFLAPSADANRGACEAVKRALDREQVDREREQGREFTSYRLCMSVAQARAEGYIRVGG